MGLTQEKRDRLEFIDLITQAQATREANLAALAAGLSNGSGQL